MEETTEMEWGRLVHVLRTCVGWSQEKLATVSGVSASAIAKQEQGLATPSRAAREKLVEALGIKGKTTRELQILFGAIRAMILDPEHRFFTRGVEAAEVATSRMMQEAVRIALVNLRTIEDDDSGTPITQAALLQMGLAELLWEGEKTKAPPGRSGGED